MVPPRPGFPFEPRRWRAAGLTATAWTSGAKGMSQQPTTILVLEQGAAWPERLAAWRPAATDTVVIAQDEIEHPFLLARRVESRTARLLAEGRPIVAAVLAVGSGAPALDPRDAAEGRARVARALLRTLHENRGEPGTLWIGAPAQLSDADRHDLLALAGALTALLHGSGVTIAVRFGEAAPERARPASGLLVRPRDVAV